MGNLVRYTFTGIAIAIAILSIAVASAEREGLSRLYCLHQAIWLMLVAIFIGVLLGI